MKRHKARLIVLGCEKKAGFVKCICPMLFSMVTCLKRFICTFLKGILLQDVKSHLLMFRLLQMGGVVARYRLLRSLNGLKQVLRLWFAKLSTTLVSFEFVQYKAHYSLPIE